MISFRFVLFLAPELRHEAATGLGIRFLVIAPTAKARGDAA
jgi:hypothetical protein